MCAEIGKITMNQNKSGFTDNSIDEVKEKIIKNREKILRDAKKIESELSSIEESKNKKANEQG